MRTEEPFPPSLPFSLSASVGHTHTQRDTHTASHAHSYTHSITVESAWLCDPRSADWRQEAQRGAKGDTPHLFWMVSAGWPVIVCLLAASLSKSAAHYGRMETAVLLASCAAGRRYVPHVWGFFFSSFSCGFYSTSFMGAVMVMVSHSWVAIVKSIPTTTTTTDPPFHCWMH